MYGNKEVGLGGTCGLLSRGSQREMSESDRPCRGGGGVWAGYPRHRENGKWQPKKSTGKTQEILLAQVVNALILKVKDIVIVAAKKINFFLHKLDRSAKSVLCM